MSTTYTIGLDIGIASVGWCILGETHIIDLGVRAFDKAETAKEGESLNLARRNARLMRRRLSRRVWRLKKLARLLKNEGLIADTKLFKPEQPCSNSLWRMRVCGLNRCLSDEEWARVIYHLCKHRGFHWNSRAEARQAEGDSQSEGGKVKQGLAGTAKLMDEKGYRSVAEMILGEFPQAQRNKQGEYTKALSRELLAKELFLLFAKQREFGNPYVSSFLETAILGNGDKKSGLFWQQKPALGGIDLLKMLGTCSFEKGEYRAPKASFTAERHVWLTRLNNLRIVIDGISRPLTEQERQLCLPLPYRQTSDLTYKQLGTALTKAGLLEPGSFKFIGLAYPTAAQKAEGKTKDPESATLIKIPAWQELRQTPSAISSPHQGRNAVGWRSVMISRPAKLRREHFSLAIEQEQTAFVPFEDIAIIVLNHREILLTLPVLSACADYGIGLYATGDNHQPNGVFLPFLAHSRSTRLMRKQMDIPRPLAGC